METLNKILDMNKDWVETVNTEDPTFFERSSKGQSPEFLWIGCADSRVPANQILGLPPGEVFVHRNIANVVVHSDLNCLSVLQYAVEVLKVKSVVVAGHYGCGGVHTSLCTEHKGLIDNWLRHIKDVQRLYKDALLACPDEKRTDLLCELNVVEQTRNIVNTTIVRDAWKRGQQLSVHGVIYDIRDGILRSIVSNQKENCELEGEAFPAVASTTRVTEDYKSRVDPER
ncbi:carbonate dehydratase [Curvivirga sp.]|uniref:carbonate dehydratase n=1 Tax=Curvivirga sp. TaxID=2856848 RepID=UPI003B596011